MFSNNGFKIKYEELFVDTFSISIWEVALVYLFNADIWLISKCFITNKYVTFSFILVLSLVSITW